MGEKTIDSKRMVDINAAVSYLEALVRRFPGMDASSWSMAG
ncbi:MAG: hypothetical protein QNI97_09860 [Desulfobacterales bacterium]|nr:hypothetical protein [Desulfobacterales bacterium]